MGNRAAQLARFGPGCERYVARAREQHAPEDPPGAQLELLAREQLPGNLRGGTALRPPGLRPTWEDELLARGANHAGRYGMELVQDSVVSARKEGDCFTVRGESRHYSAHRLLIATGIYHLPPKIEGPEEHTQYEP